MKRLVYLLIIIFVFQFCFIKCTIAANGGNQPEIIEKIITVEGSVEKPRVIFIVPRARLQRPWINRKSLIPAILEPVYPDFLKKEGDDINSSRR